MIWVLAGTGDSFELIDYLQEKKSKLDIISSVVTDYGKEKIEDKDVKVIKKKLDRSQMVELINEYNIELIIDATHPFAEAVSRNTIAASNVTDTKYLRYERETIDLSQYPDQYILPVHSYQEAAQKADEFEKVFLTIGSNNLNYFTDEIDKWQERLTVRILPNWKFIKKAEEIGFLPENIIALQGPFSQELNQVLFKEYGADVLVSKASGNVGGLDTKIKAAVELKIPIIIIRRPAIDYPLVVNDFENILEHCSRKGVII